MTKQQAFEIVVQALEGANVGQRFSLKDSATIFTAVGVLGNALQVEQPIVEAEVEMEQKPQEQKDK